MASYCIGCGNELPDGAGFCPDDGAPAVGRDQGDPASGRLIDQRYRLLTRIGSGGVGTVYRAVHVKIRRPAAVKLLRREYTSTTQVRGRFEREARAASRLDHPGCVAVTDFGACGWELFLVMELLEGRSLADALDAGPMTTGAALRIAVQMLDALDHAHTKGVVHRDLKPGNVFLCEDKNGSEPRVKICDFGFAKILAADAGVDPIVTDTGTVFGTPAYMSPEQATASSVGPPSDQYSATAVIFELLGGSVPFPGGDAKELLLKHVTAAVPDVRERNLELSGALAEVLRRGLAKRPAERFAGVRALRDALLDTPEGRHLRAATDTVLDTVIEIEPTASRETARDAKADRRRATQPPARAGGAVGPLSEESTKLALEEAGALSHGRRSARLRRMGAWATAAVALLCGAALAGWIAGSTPSSEASAARGIDRSAAEPATVRASGGAVAGAEVSSSVGAVAGAAGADLALISEGAATARARWLAGDEEGALAAAFAASRARPGGDAHAHVIIGHVYFARGWRSDAIGHYRRATDLDPSLRSDLRLRSNLKDDDDAARAVGIGGE